MASIFSFPRKRPIPSRNVGGSDVARLQSLLRERRMVEAAELLDESSKRSDLFALSFKPVEIDESDPILIVFEPPKIQIHLLAYRSRAKQDAQAHRLLTVRQMLVAAADMGARGTVRLCLMDHDNCDAVSFCSNRMGSALIPDPEYLESNAYRGLADALAVDPVEWNDRRPVVFWRGVTTGQQIEGDWRRLPRIALCRRTADRDGFDVGLTRVVQIAEHGAEAELRAQGLMRGFAPMTEAAANRYQLDIDGNSNAWAGLFQKLLTGSPVLKIASPSGFRQWYYDKLVPFVNFVPVATDLNDLDERVDWLRRNDEVARKVGQAGRDLAVSLRYERECSAAARVIAQRAN